MQSVYPSPDERRGRNEPDHSLAAFTVRRPLLLMRH